MGIDDHQLDDEGEHDEDECEVCYEQEFGHCGTCGCGKCCESLLVEVSLRDAEREPKIAQLCRPLKDPFVEGAIVGYLLNKPGSLCCTFFDQTSRQCTIYETRPLVCRCFDCRSWLEAEARQESGEQDSDDDADQPPPQELSVTNEEHRAVLDDLQATRADALRLAPTLGSDDVQRLRRLYYQQLTGALEQRRITQRDWYQLLWPGAGRL